MSDNERLLTIAEKIIAAGGTGKEPVFHVDPPLNMGNSYTFTPEGLDEFFKTEKGYITDADLGNSSGLDVGTTAGTVAAGDDSRIVNAVQPGDPVSDLTETSTAKIMTDAERTKLFDLPTNAALTTALAGKATAAQGALADTALQPNASDSQLQFLQSGTGAVARTTRSKLRERISVVDFGAVGDGSTNDGPAINAAIAAAKARGGGIVFFPQPTSSYRHTGTITIDSSSISLLLETPLTKITFANGTSDCITIDGTSVGGAGIYNIDVKGGLIEHTGKTGGVTVKFFKANNVLFDNVQINNSYQTFDCNVINNVTLRECRVVNWDTNQPWMKFRAPSDGSARSDVLTLINCSTNGTGNGIEWSGYAHTLRIYGGNCINVKKGIYVTNPTTSTQYFPQFLEAIGWELDGATQKCLDITAGRDFDLTACVMVCASSAAGPVIDVAADATGSITSNLKIEGGKYKGGQGKILSFSGRDLTVVGTTQADGSSAGSGVAQVIELTATAQNCYIVGNRLGGYYGSGINHSYAITVANGATKVFAENNDCSNCVTGEMLNNSTSNTISLGGGLRINGIFTDSFLGSRVIRNNVAATIEDRITNQATGAAVQARRVYETGTANSFVVHSLIDNTGVPYFIENSGSGVVTSYKDFDTQIYRTNAASEKMRITTARMDMNLPIKLKSYTFATLPASPQQGDLAIITDSNTTTFNAAAAGGGANVIKVCYLGGSWKVA